jgi:hypothetical protein
VQDVDWQARADRLYAGYLTAQAVLGIVLWVVLLASPAVREGFELVPERRLVTTTFVFGDIGIIVIGSAIGAWGIRERAPWTVPAVAFTAGAVMYPTLYLIGWVALTGTGSAGLAVMVPVSTLTCWVAYRVYRDAPRTERPR